jgi:beta-galactosidase
MSTNGDNESTEPGTETTGISRRGVLQATGGMALLPGLLRETGVGNARPSMSGKEMTPDEISLTEYIENPLMIGENQEPGHVPTIPYPSVRMALNLDRAHGSPWERWDRSPFFRSLNGEWDFRWSINPSVAPDDFDASEEWDSITVPRVWQTEGYGHPMYRNIVMDLWPYDPPSVPDTINPVGAYQRTFTVSQNWTKERRTFLRFQGVKSAYFVWINGEYVGYDEGSMTAGEFDVTPHLDSGKNTISVQVFRWSDGSYLENQDMWRFSGIYRDVYLYSTPDTHLRDYFVQTDLDENYEDATLRIDAEVANYSDESGSYTVRAHLFDPEYRKVTKLEGTTTVTAGESTGVTLETEIEDPDKWSAEQPNVYRLGFELLLANSPSQRPLETQLAKVGFREYEIIDNQIHVNGEPVAFGGVNLHDHHPEFGRYVTTEMRRKDFVRAKQFNVNAFRNSHYPRGPEFYEFADEYGIYVCDEVNAETHQNTNLVNEYPAFHDSFLDRFKRMLQQWKNHASVFMWSTGNEAGLGPAHFDMAEYATEVDGTRFLYHQANNGGVAPYAPVIGPRYPSPSELVSIATSESEQRPAVMGEYNHAMGNSLGLITRFWEEIAEYSQLQGGFVWDWVNQELDRALVVTPDATEHDNDGSLHGNPTIVTDTGNMKKEEVSEKESIDGTGLSLTGLDDWVELYRDPSLDITEPGLTLEVRVKPREPWTGSDPYITKGDEQYALKMKDEETLEFFVYDPEEEWVSVDTTVSDDWTGNWHHVAGVHTGSELRLYIDGELKGTEQHSGSINHIHYPVNVGRNSQKHNENWNAWLSNATFKHACIYNRALSREELRSDRSKPGEGCVLWLDFEEFVHEGRFRSYGIDPFCCNGVVYADREPQPSLWQMKKAHQPVEVAAVDLVEGELSITNEYDFTNLNSLNTSWTLAKDDEVLQTGSLSIGHSPEQEREVTVPFEKPTLEAGSEYWLTVRFSMTEDTRWADAGHEVAFEQFEVPFDVPTAPLASVEEMPSLSVKRREQNRGDT